MPMVTTSKYSNNRSATCLRFLDPEEREAVKAERMSRSRSTAMSTNSGNDSDEGCCQLTRDRKKMLRARELSRQQWANEVLINDSRTRSKATQAASEAQVALEDVCEMLVDCQSDTVSQVKDTLARIDETCQKKLDVIEQQKEKERQQQELREQLRKKRAANSSSFNRRMGFGNISNQLNKKVHEEQQVQLRWNTYGNNGAAAD